MVRKYHCSAYPELYNRGPMTPKLVCEELERLRREYASALFEAKKIRLSRDVSISEDFELNREGHRRIYALIRHLLVGHDGSACPAGDRPIVRASKSDLTPRRYNWLSVT